VTALSNVKATRARASEHYLGHILDLVGARLAGCGPCHDHVIAEDE
jgi:hypothetical protein